MMKKLLTLTLSLSLCSILGFSQLSLANGEQDCSQLIFGGHTSEHFISPNHVDLKDLTKGTYIRYHAWLFDEISYYTQPELIALRKSAIETPVITLKAVDKNSGKTLKTVGPITASKKTYHLPLAGVESEFSMIDPGDRLYDLFSDVIKPKSKLNLEIELFDKKKPVCKSVFSIKAFEPHHH